jgi:hypothetical protein
MRTVTQNIKVELESDERVALNEARIILDNFLESMKNEHCSNAYFEDCGVEYTASEIQDAIDLIEVLSDENPTIQ